MTAPSNCPKCGAPPLGGESRFCTICGSELAVQSAEPAAPGAAALEDRFIALRAYPTFGELCAYDPQATASSLGLGSQKTAGIILTLLGIGATAGFTVAGGPAGIVGIVIVIFGLFVFRRGVVQAWEFDSAPLDAFPAAMLGDRVKVTGGGEDQAASTAYFATVQNAEGERKEYQVTEQVASKAFAGDVGIGYTKGKYLVDFIVVPV